MKADSISMSHILVACISVDLGGVGYYSDMSLFFIGNCAISAVANYATDLTVSALHEIGIFQEDLLPYLQRRQFTASAFSRGFA